MRTGEGFQTSQFSSDVAGHPGNQMLGILNNLNKNKAFV